MNLDTTLADSVLTMLREIKLNETIPNRICSVANDRIESIEKTLKFVTDDQFKVTFIGQIGVGKSSMIGVVSDLIISDHPTTKAMLKENSVLTVGAGGTTICEVRIRKPIKENFIGLVIEPLTVEEMKQEIDNFAIDEWNRRNNGKDYESDSIDNNENPTPREYQRAIRSMTGLKKSHITITEKGQRKRQEIDPIDDIIKKFDSKTSFAQYLVDKASLLLRDEIEWWWENNEEALKKLKISFDDINNGEKTTAMLPKRIFIYAENLISESIDDVNVEIIDTRGFDGELAGRSDIQELLRDEKSVIVICTPFKDAPGAVVKKILEDVNANGEYNDVEDRMILVLMDHNDAGQVNGCDDDRETGQSIKINECKRVLDNTKTSRFSKNIISFDCLVDAPDYIRQNLSEIIKNIRVSADEKLLEKLGDANAFLINLENENIRLACDEIDKRMKIVLQANFPSGNARPLNDPMESLYSTLTYWRYASQILASCRRYGDYFNLNAYAVIRSGAANAVTVYLNSFRVKMQGFFESIENDEEFKDVHDHIRLRKGQFDEIYSFLISDYANRVFNEISLKLRISPVWYECSNEWGRGSGFKQRVLSHLRNWSTEIGGFSSHTQLSEIKLIASEK